MQIASHPTLGIPGLFITGTDTDVGKTYVTASLAAAMTAAHRQVAIYKPACSGAEIRDNGEPYWNDIEQLFAASGGWQPRDVICPQRFSEPLAPPVAARAESRSINEELLRVGLRNCCRDADAVLIEGVGGLLCPITETMSVAELAVEFGFPILIVARLGLGTINHTLMTVEIAERRGLQIAGVLLNQTSPADGDPSTSTNPAEIAKRISPPVLGILPYEGRQLLPIGDQDSKIEWWAPFEELFRERQSDDQN